MWITYEDNMRPLIGEYNIHLNSNCNLSTSNYNPFITSHIMIIQKQVVNKVEITKYHHF